MPRSPMYGTTTKKATTVSMPAGLYEFFSRYSGRERNASGGISLAILALVQKNQGARYLMSQVIAAGLSIPDDMVGLVKGWDKNVVAQGQAKILRETGLAYDAQLKETGDKETGDDEPASPPQVGRPPLFEQPTIKRVISLTEGEMEFLDKLGTGKRPRSQGLRFLAEHLWMLDPDAAQIVCDIWREGVHFMPQLFLDIVQCGD